MLNRRQFIKSIAAIPFVGLVPVVAKATCTPVIPAYWLQTEWVSLENAKHLYPKKTEGFKHISEYKGKCDVKEFGSTERWSRYDHDLKKWIYEEI